MDILLMGNPNSGKTTLFNRLTGLAHHVGSFPGVTVERAEGQCLLDPSIRIIDVPGLYSLAPFSRDESVSAELLAAHPPGAILCVVDATCPARGLYLLLQLRETGIPVAVALTMMDEVQKSGGTVDMEALSAVLSLPVATAWRAGLESLLAAAQRARGGNATPLWDIAARYAEVDRVCGLAFHGPEESVAQRRSAQIDRIATHRALAFPLFLFLMAGIFFIAFGPIGNALGDGTAWLIEALSAIAARLLAALSVAPWLRSLLLEGIAPGISLILSFVPTLALLFLLLSILEDSGYMARMSFCMDRPLRAIGLSGRAFVPLLIGFGCSVPAILSTRTLPTRRERMLAILFVPFLSCSAKIPVYALFANAFFPGRQLALIACLYGFGIAAGALAMAVLERIAPGSGAPYLLELPAYRLPSFRSVLARVWTHTEKFLKSATTLLLLSSVAVWALQRVSPQLTPVSDSNQSLLAALGRAAAPAFLPLGFADWRASTALLSGLLAKENVLSTLGVLLASSGTSALSLSLPLFLSPLSALSFLVFTLLYMPCIASFAAARRELGGWYALLMALFQTGVAWLCAGVVYNVGCLLV